MSEFQASNFKKENGGTPDLLGKTELTSPYFFVPPSGTTAERPQSCAPGTLRFNTDIGTLEVYRGDTVGWEQIQRRESQYLGGGSGSNAGLGHRGVAFGGNTGSIVNTMEFITISTLGNAQDFGDLTTVSSRGGALSSATRGVRGGGQTPSTINTIEFITIASTGNASNFGDLNYTPKFPAPMANSVRGIWAGGYTPSLVDTMDFVTIAQTGNAIDFGDLNVQRNRASGCSSPTRGLVLGGASSSPNPSFLEGMNHIDFVTIMSTGNGTDFGDLSVTKFQNVAVSNATRGVIFGGRTQPNGDANNVIDFVTIATTGNAIDFGDDSVAKTSSAGVSSPTRGVSMGGQPGYNIIEFVEIATTGNAKDFGDLVSANKRQSTGGASSGHGGL